MTLLLALLCSQSAIAEPTSAARTAEAAEVMRYADWLFQQGDYYRAIGEYQRTRYLDPAGPHASEAGLRLASAYAAGGKPDAAVVALRLLAGEAPEPAVRDGALYEQGRVRYLAGQAEAALSPLAAYSGLPAPAGGPGKKRALLLLSLARLGSGDEEGALRAQAPLPASEAEAGAALRSAIEEVARAPHRSPLAAGLLSAAVPGLGHAYAGDPLAGAGALAVNGVFVWATFEAFRDRRPGLGTLLLVGESLWYGGAIFGAVAEAMRFNRDARAAALAQVDRRFRWVLEPVSGGATLGFRQPLD